MKKFNNMRYIYLFIFLISATSSYSQTSSEKAKITESYDLKKSKELQTYLQSEYEKMNYRISLFLNSLTPEERDNIDITKLRDVTEDGIPLFEESHNKNSAVTIRADHFYTGGSLGLDVNGENMIAGVWEAENGLPLTSHLDLAGRITVIDGSAGNTFHATHVTGTIISSGNNIVLDLGRGIAYEASVLAATSSNDTSEMATQASLGLLVSNHSYGLLAGALPVERFGAYTSRSFNGDLVTSTYPYYLPVISAGNDRDDFASYNPTKAGYDLLTDLGCSKNVITSAAVSQVLNYTQPSDVVMSGFSNWGPTDDGRIKPDISSKGVGVLSTSNASNTAYANSQGTSMSAPAISGLLLLMQQHYNNVNSNYMLAATAKGLLLHTADEAGFFPGPDYGFGWGLANGKQAAEVISNNGTTSFIDETQLIENATNTFDITAFGNQPLMVSICWTDPADPGSIDNSLDDLTPDVVNDLDVKLTSDGTDYYPWKLNIAAPSSSATRNSTNDVDNFEKIQVDSPNVNQVYTVNIDHKAQLLNGQQNYSIIISGGIPTSLSADEYQLANSLVLHPNPSKGDFTVSFNMSTIEDVKVDVYDITGRLVLTKDYLASSTRFDQTISIPNANAGMYVVNISSGDNSVTKKLIIN